MIPFNDVIERQYYGSVYAVIVRRDLNYRTECCRIGTL